MISGWRWPRGGCMRRCPGRCWRWLPERGVTDVRRLSRRGRVGGGGLPRRRSYGPGSMRTVVTALRVLCRFLEDAGWCAGLSRGGAGGVRPACRGRCPCCPPTGCSELVASPDPATPVGRRNRAMLLLAARTGLRPCDIVGLRLRGYRLAARTDHRDPAQDRDACWRCRCWPMSATAIAEYLLHGRPAGAADEHVFLRSPGPVRRASPRSDLYHVAAGAFARAAIAYGGRYRPRDARVAGVVGDQDARERHAAAGDLRRAGPSRDRLGEALPGRATRPGCGPAAWTSRVSNRRRCGRDRAGQRPGRAHREPARGQTRDRAALHDLASGTCAPSTRCAPGSFPGRPRAEPARWRWRGPPAGPVSTSTGRCGGSPRSGSWPNTWPARRSTRT